MLRTYPSQINDIKELLSQIPENNLTLVEIGSFMGESMNLFAQSNKFAKIFCVDPWLPNYDSTDGCSFSNFQEIETEFDNRAKNYSFVSKIKKFSIDAASDFEDESIDIVYIDGMHTKEAVKNDIKVWLPKVKNTGYITGHDWYLKEGLLQSAIIESIGYPDYVCKHLHVDNGYSDGSWLKKKINIKTTS